MKDLHSQGIERSTWRRRSLPLRVAATTIDLHSESRRRKSSRSRSWLVLSKAIAGSVFLIFQSVLFDGTLYSARAAAATTATATVGAFIATDRRLVTCYCSTKRMKKEAYACHWSSPRATTFTRFGSDGNKATETHRPGVVDDDDVLINDSISRSNDDDGEDVFLTLPVFPLRKTVRLPTEQLTLNLYEERYLDMARYILDDESNIGNKDDEDRQPTGSDLRGFFGALYTTNKPQIVTDGGMGPIVPIVEEGDIGTIFHVERSEQGYIPTYKSDPRFRIRLVGRGISRFQIRKIVQNGYGKFNAKPNRENNNTPVCEKEDRKRRDHYPFILVEAKIIKDIPLREDAKKLCDGFVKDFGSNNQRTKESKSKHAYEYFNTMVGSQKSKRAWINVEEEWDSFQIAREVLDDTRIPERLQSISSTNTLSRLKHLTRK